TGASPTALKAWAVPPGLVGEDLGGAADRDRGAGVGEVEDREADAGVAAEVAHLLESGGGREEDGVALALDPGQRVLRGAVGAEVGDADEVLAVEEGADGVGEGDGIARGGRHGTTTTKGACI